jgi:hypothetical protein
MSIDVIGVHLMIICEMSLDVLFVDEMSVDERPRDDL